MAHAARARQLQEEYVAATGIRPKYPRSRVALQGLRETLDRYKTAMADLKANDARRQGAKNLEDEFSRLNKIEADDFDLDTPTSAGQLEGKAGRLLRRAKAQHRREGAAHAFSSWRQEIPDPYEFDDVVVDSNISIRGGNIVSDYTLTAERATEVLNKLSNGKFLVKVKFLREQAPGVWVYEDGFAPLRQGRTRGGEVVEVTPETRPGALEGIDRLYYVNAYPVSAVVYGLYPIREPDERNLDPMRDGDLNCVAQRVIKHFDGAQRGQGLTPERREKIAQWEARVHDDGATLRDVAELEKILKRAVIVRDITGADLYNSRKYQHSGWKTIELTLHNGHAWGADLHFPQTREIAIYKGDVWAAIQEATQGEPKAVWVLGGGQNKRLTVDQFVLEDGRTFRTQETHNSLLEMCRHLAPEDPEALAGRVFGENHAASVVTREKNAWKPTPVNLLDIVQAACVEHGHGGLWNAPDYHVNEVVSIDMKACYPASFQGKGEAAPWFQRFGHPRHRMTRVAVNGPLPVDIGTGFAQVSSWQFAVDLHPVVAACIGSHFQEKKWALIPLLAYMVETGLLAKLQVAEAIVAFKKQTEVWLPDSRDQACSVIGKFTQGAKADGRRLTRRLVTDQGELDFLVSDCRQSGTLVGAPEQCPVGWILTYYDGSQPQFAHLRASMLAYAHINLLEMLRRFAPSEAVRVATDSIYMKKTALHKLYGVEAYIAPQICSCEAETCLDCLLGEKVLPLVAPAQWRDKGETIFSPQDHAAYEPKPEHWGASNDVADSTAPSHADPLTRHALSYLNGGGGSGKTTRANELFRGRKPLVFAPTHRLAKEMRSRGVYAQTYHSSLGGRARQSGLRTAWAPRDQAQKLLFERHKEAFPDEPVPLLYRPRDTRLQNVLVTIPGPLLVDDGQPDQQELVLNDVVEVSVETAQEVLDGKWGQNWALGYAMTVHSSQGLTIKDPQKVWIVDDYIQWSNLAYLAVSRVQYLNQLARCCPPPDADGRPPPVYDEAVARKNIGRKLQAYKRVDAAKGLKCNLRLRIKDVEALKEKQSNRCASCNIDLLWCYEPKDTRQFSVDRIDNAKGHTRDNVRLACLECNRKRGAAALTHCEATKNDGVPPGNVSAGQLQDLFDSI
ncbi:hypothetical protein RRG08_039082 [Elysia crispata]|uniref:Uncharacterized protein n=1 Tax=Elysia crispata TaxID=231223 RepID=A0AAE1CZR4_9GAST|nr:hypothetical protein RRG08_039082 [Elysia crispata]